MFSSLLMWFATVAQASCASGVCQLPPTSQIVISAGTYGESAGRWSKALSDRAKVGSISYINTLGKDKLHKNKSRDYIVWIPEGTKDGAIGVVWFHGHTGFSKRTFEKRILNQFVPHMGKKNFFVVLPEMPWSWNTSTRTRRNGQIWTKPGEFLSFMDEVKGVVARRGINNINWRVIGHSAGGSTIATIGSTEDICQLNPTRVIWSDSTYGKWIAKANRGCLQEFVTDIYITGHRSTGWFPKKFVKTHAGRNVNIHQKRLTHKQIGDNIVSLSGVLDD